MEAAARADERRKLKMELMRELASRSPAPAATSTCSAPDTSSPRLPLQAIFSPSAPQVEYNMLDKMARATEGAQDLHAPKGREQDQEQIMRRETRSVIRIKNFKIPPPAVPSDIDEENIDSHPKRIIALPFGSSLSPKAFLEQVQRRLPLTSVNAHVGSAQDRQLDHLKEDTTRFTFPPSLRAFRGLGGRRYVGTEHNFLKMKYFLNFFQLFSKNLRKCKFQKMS
jgi:hypothetical protein